MSRKFRRLTVEMFLVRLRFEAGMVDNAVPMIGRRIERMDPQWNTVGIDAVALSPGRDEQGLACADQRAKPVQNGLTSFSFR